MHRYILLNSNYSKHKHGAIPTIELSSDGCDLEAKRLLEELEIIMHAFGIEMIENEFWRKEIFEGVSRALKVYMVRNLITEEKLEELLKNWFWKLEREKEKTKNIESCQKRFWIRL